ncbi:MAG: phage tail protein [Desulfovibrio sp.]
MITCITAVGENLINQKQAKEAPLHIDKFILANVPNMDPAAPIDRLEVVPTAQVVYEHEILADEIGYADPDEIIYSMSLDENIGDFTFNWIGLYSSEDDTLVAIAHAPETQKTKKDGSTNGNTLVRNFLLTFNGAQACTKVTINAKTWKVDFSSRPESIDAREQASNIDIYGESIFWADGFKVIKEGELFSVLAGKAYVHGIRIVAEKQNISPVLPQSVYLDVALLPEKLDVLAESKVVLGTDLTNYRDESHYQHYVVKLADIAIDGTITDSRKVLDISGSMSEWCQSKMESLETTINALQETLDNKADIIRAPEAISPLASSGKVQLDVILEATPFSPAFSIDTRVTREFQIDLLGGDFSAPVAAGSVNASSWQVEPKLAPATAYKWRCRDVANTDKKSPWMVAEPFNTVEFVIETPTLTVPGAPDAVQETPTLSGSSYVINDPAGTHTSTDWEVLKDGVSVWSSTADTNNLTSITIPASILVVGTPYEFKMRYNSSVAGVSSEWSIVMATTAAEFVADFFLAVAHQKTPYLSIFGKTNDSFTKLTDPAELPTADGGGVSFSKDGQYLATCGHHTHSFCVYKRSGNTFTKLSISEPPTEETADVKFSDDGKFLAVTTQAIPYLYIYVKEGDNFRKLPTLADRPLGKGNFVDFSPDNKYMAVGYTGAPYYFVLYEISGETFTKVDTPVGGNFAVAFSPDNKEVASGAGNINIFKRVNGKLEKNTAFASNINGNIYGLAYSPDGQYLAAGHLNAPFLTMFKKEGESYTKIPVDLAGAATERIFGVAFSADGKYLAIGADKTPYICIFERNGDTFTPVDTNHMALPGDARSIAFHPAF